MDFRERFPDSEETHRVSTGAALLATWTALPGIVQSYDPTTGTAVVQPAIQGTTATGKGTLSQTNLPPLNDVPVQFPTGGGVTLTLPIAKGDEVLLIFSSRCLDQWHAAGGVQRAGSNRHHDLSDAIAIAGVRSQPRKLANVSTTVAQLRSDDGSTFVSLDPQGKVVGITASGGIKIVGPVMVAGTITSTGDVVAAGISLDRHVHGGVQSGNSETAGPVG